MTSKPSFQLISDLHLEFCKELPILEKKADNLILAGDVGYPTHENFTNLMKVVCEQFDKVFYVPGNHEYYCSLPKEEVDELLLQQSKDIGFILLNNSTYKLSKEFGTNSADDLTVIGTTLWTRTTPSNSFLLKSYMNDYRKIKIDKETLITPEITGKWHEEAVLFLYKEFSVPGDKLVITHHLPSMELIHEKYQGHPINCGFASSLDIMFKGSGVKVWCAGHTHSQISKKIGDIQFYINPVGYPGENPEADTSFNFTV